MTAQAGRGTSGRVCDACANHEHDRRLDAVRADLRASDPIDLAGMTYVALIVVLLGMIGVVPVDGLPRLR